MMDVEVDIIIYMKYNLGHSMEPRALFPVLQMSSALSKHSTAVRNLPLKKGSIKKDVY